MAKVECDLYGDFDMILQDMEDTILGGSFSASMEDRSDFFVGNCRCAVRVYERYSFFGGNRVSLNLTLLEAEGQVKLSAITSGGSQAVFFKVNTLSEETFLDTVRSVIDDYQL